MDVRDKQIYLGVLGIIIIILLVIVIFLVRAYQKGSFVSDQDLIKSVLESSEISRRFATRLKDRTKDLKLQEILDRFLTSDQITTKELEDYLKELS